jgi:cytochrome P450
MDTEPADAAQGVSAATGPRSLDRPTAARRAPGPRGLDLLRTLNSFRRNPLPTLERLTREHGDAVSVRLPGRPAFLFSHPDQVRHILIGRSENYLKTSGTRAARRFFGDSMQLNNGDRARSMRRLLAPLFTFDRVASAYAGLVVEETRAAIRDWSPGPRVALTDQLMELVLHIMVGVHFGTRGDDTRRLGALYAKAFALLPQYALPEWVATPGNRRYAAAVAALDAAILARLAAARQHDRGDDLGAAFLRIGLSETQARHELVSMMAAAYGTVGMTLVQTLRLLAESPVDDGRVAEEVSASASPFPDLRTLPYTGKVVKESMRLCPPAGVVMRRAAELEGWAVPAGARILLSSWLVQRDPRYYEEPLAFRPERWTPAFELRLPPGAYFPLGAGPRSCIGGVLSDVTLRLIIATIVARFRLEAPVTPAERSAWPLLLADGGLRATVHLR